MFSPLSQPLDLAPGQLELVRFSLNQPVVSTAEVAPGPARAAIVVHREGGVRFHTVVVRPVREGRPALYRLEEPDLPDDVALDASLSFAESMGFLFDDEAQLDAASKEGAETLATLGELLGDTADAVGAEILLDELAAREPPPPVSLSRFRLRVPGPAPVERAEPARAEVAPETAAKPRSVLGLGRRLLGRVRPVRRRAQSEAPGPVLRLRSWF